MKKINLLLLQLLAISCLVSLCVGMITVSAETVKTVDEVEFTMTEGASIRKAVDYDGTGIRYSINMPTSDYDALMLNVGDGKAYSSIKFGVFVAPYETYYLVHNFDNEDTLKQYYYWNETISETEKAGKAQIINIDTADLTLDEENSNRYFNASVVKMLSSNLLTEYIGIGYICYEVDGVEHYKFAAKNNNVRSMVYVAQAAIGNNEIGKEKLEEFYLTSAVTSQTTTYKTEYYLSKPNGTYEIDNSLTVTSEPTGINADVTAATQSIEGFVYDSDNAENVESAKVYANGKLTLKLYYDFNLSGITKITDNVTNLVDLKDKTEYILADLLNATDKDKFERYAKSGNFTWTLTNKSSNVETTSNGIITDFVKTQFSVKAELSDGTTTKTVYEGNADFYNSSEVVYLNDLVAAPGYSVKYPAAIKPATGQLGATVEVVNIANESIAGGRTGNYYKINTNGYRTAFSVLLNHSTEYYELYRDYVLSFDVFITCEDVVTQLNFCPFGQSGSTFYMNVGNTMLNKWSTYNTVGKTTTPATVGTILDNIVAYNASNNVTYSLMDYAMNINGNWQTGGDTTIYIGNIIATPQVTITCENDSVANLVDLKDNTSTKYNLTNLMSSDANKNYVNHFSQYVNYTLTDNIGNQVFVNDAVIDLTNVDKISYYVNVKFGSIALYNGIVDFYDSTDGLVFSTVRNGKYVTRVISAAEPLALSAKVSGSIVTASAENPIGNFVSGEFYKVTKVDEEGTDGTGVSFAFIPIHSKEYYATFGDDLVKYKMTYSIYVSASVAGASYENKFTLRYAADNNWNATNSWFNQNPNYNTLQTLTFTVSLDKLLSTNYDYYTSCALYKSINTTPNSCFYSNATKNKGTWSIYYGNMSVAYVE